MSTQTFYVYEHWRPDTDVCFYVGKGTGIRANNMSRRNAHHKAIQAKLAKNGMAVEVRMVAVGLNQPEAFRIEIERIKFWKDSNVRLTNQSDGGDGNVGYAHTPEAKIKISKRNLELGIRPPVLFGEKNPFYGKTHSEEARKIMSETAKNRIVTDETRKKMSETRKRLGIKPPRRSAKKELV
jgi:predicted GIY-YIG superfamily endonuclease